MRKRISKTAVLSACMHKQQDLIHHFSQRMEEARSIAFDHSDTPSQTDEGSNSPGEIMQVMSQELGFAQAELEILRGIDPNDPARQVERGAVVVTDKRVFFIAVSSEEILIEGEKIFGMSEKAPLYAVMRGLKIGDSFEFNHTKYRIEDIY